MSLNRLHGWPARILAALCVLIAAGILFAGLWPLGAPRNDVAWLPGGGLSFGRVGIAVSSQAFHPAGTAAACTIEIGLEPEHPGGSGTILAFDSFPNPRYPFAIRQMGDGLAIQRTQFDSHGGLDRRWLLTPGIFAGGKPVTVAITGDGSATTVYADGKRVNSSTDFGLSASDLSGRLVLGNSTMKDGWRGSVFGLALLESVLSQTQIEQDTHGGWNDRARTRQEPVPVALYGFAERSGTRVRDLTGSGNDLEIAAKYFQLHPAFLDPPWNQFRTRWDGWMSRGYWSDNVLNVVGFMPLGFLFAAYLGLVRGSARARLLATLAGIAISLSIELTQYFLPTRDSSMTDLLTNAAGSALGAWLYLRRWETKLSGRMESAGGY